MYPSLDPEDLHFGKSSVRPRIPAVPRTPQEIDPVPGPWRITTEVVRSAEGGFCDMVQAQSEGPTSGARDTSCSAVSGPRSTGIPPHNLRYRSVFAGTVSTELLVRGDNGLSSWVLNSLSASFQSRFCHAKGWFYVQNGVFWFSAQIGFCS